MDLRLGQELRDRVSGLVGIAVARVEYLNGCVQFCIQPPAEKGTRPDGVYVDQQQLEVSGPGIEVSRTFTGGPSDNSPRATYAG